VTVAVPTLTLERRLTRERGLLIALDEVGRGALAGPVCVGASAMDEAGARRRVPVGLRDSKLIPEARRQDVAERAAAWVRGSALGWASAEEVDSVGIMRALGLAALRALDGLRTAGFEAADAVIILDGNHDYISPAGGWGLDVRPVIKADRDCASAAVASVIAKVARDDLMVTLHEEAPIYQWSRNKGYASAEHREAIVQHGISRHHRASWAFEGNTLF